MTYIPRNQPPIRDRRYLDHLRTQPCIVTGLTGDDIDPAHIGTLGKGLKMGDDCTLPLSNELHRLAHQRGEMTVLREMLPDHVFRAALQAYAREQYREWKEGR